MLRVIFIVALYFVYTASALQCRNCSQTLNLASSEIINMAGPECVPITAEYWSCSQLLHVQYPEKKASVRFEPTLSESLVLSNAVQMMTNTTMIWLNKFQFDRTFQIFCFDDNACQKDTISQTYVQVRTFEHSELWAYLVSRLYEAPRDHADLVCANNQDKPVSCPYGFCQSISSDSTSSSHGCVLNNSLSNPYGVLLQSKTTSESKIESSVMYTCNKPMCNNSTMTKEVRNLLEVRNILFQTTTTTTATTTTTTITTTAPTTSTKKRSTGNTVKPWIGIQCALVLLMAFPFQP